MPSARQIRWQIESALLLPFLWGFAALVLALIIPPPSLGYQLEPLYRDGPATTGRSALILTAHPDDESMFFTPTILGLKNAGWEISGLCLSNGNADGVGKEREAELREAWDALGIKETHYTLLNDPAFEDGMHTIWDIKRINTVVNDHLAKHPAELVFTFDSAGISLHPNHVALSHFRPTSPKTHLYHLKTPSLLAKYSGPFNPIVRRGHYHFAKGISEWMDVFDMKHTLSGDFSVTNGGLDWIRAVGAMWQHKTQLAWYRYGWTLTSGLMWANDLVLVQ